jgi:hypothetical protein
MDWEIFQDSLSNPQISKECRGWHGTIFTGRILWYKNKKADASLYGTLENRIDGVVITFSNITAAKTLEAQLRQTQAEPEKRVE